MIDRLHCLALVKSLGINMGNRLSKIYTRQGDDGRTGLGDGSRIEKHSDLIEAIGSIDELNCLIGLVLVEEIPDQQRSTLTDIQHMLFNIGGDLCIPGRVSIKPSSAIDLEERLDQMNADLPPLKEFILPGGHRAAALCHQARAVCRRAERRLCRLLTTNKGLSIHCQYINRLSDVLFVMARYINKEHNTKDVYWQSGRFED